MRIFISSEEFHLVFGVLSLIVFLAALIWIAIRELNKDTEWMKVPRIKGMFSMGDHDRHHDFDH